MRVADTSLWIAFFSDGDKFHAQAVPLVEDGEPILVPFEVLAETLGVIQARYGRSVAREVYRQMVALPHVEVIDEVRLHETRDLWLSAEKNLTWVDAAVVVLARARAAAVLTFDRDIHATMAESPTREKRS